MLKNILFTLFCVLCLTFPSYSYEWPFLRGVVVNTMGGNYYGTFTPGIEISGDEQQVFPIEDGEIVYYQEETQGMQCLPSCLGNVIVLEHKGGMRSTYGHLKKDSIPKNVGHVSKITPVGILGMSGYTDFMHLNLQTYDMLLKQTVNPLLLLPKQKDQQTPLLDSIVLNPKNKSLTDGKSLPLASKISIKSGFYRIEAKAYDLSEPYLKGSRARMAPYKMSVYLNGEAVFKVTFDALIESNHKMAVAGTPAIPWEIIYSSDDTMSTSDILFNPGNTNLEIIISDIFGNEQIRSFSFLVQ